MPQAVNGKPLTAEARVRSQASQCAICDDTVASGQIFSEYFYFPLSVLFHQRSKLVDLSITDAT
jgi:hypothetical protein